MLVSTHSGIAIFLLKILKDYCFHQFLLFAPNCWLLSHKLESKMHCLLVDKLIMLLWLGLQILLVNMVFPRWRKSMLLLCRLMLIAPLMVNQMKMTGFLENMVAQIIECLIYLSIWVTFSEIKGMRIFHSRALLVCRLWLQVDDQKLLERFLNVQFCRVNIL